MWNFLIADNLTMWLADVEHPMRQVFPDRRAFVALVSVHDRLKSTPLLRAGSWLMVCVVLCGLNLRRSSTREGAFVLGVCGSAVIYVASFFVVGVASDFRYGYWAVLAALAAAAVTASGPGDLIAWQGRSDRPALKTPTRL
jgi:peptidoglycan/LPS O-acetylase OafA/YrhL